ncbi:Rid family hydrolase [Vibrio metschnikovii]
MTGEVPADIAAQAKQSLDNVKAVVESAGLTVGDIVKMTVFVKDLNDFGDRESGLWPVLMIITSPITLHRSCVEVALLYRKMLGLKLKRSLFVDMRSAIKKAV